MADYEQMELDVRLDSEKNLKDNMAKVITFAYESRNREMQESGKEIKPIRNKHEGYGMAAEAFAKIQNMAKGIKTGMSAYLGLLQVKGDDAISVCGTLYSSALDLAIEAVNIAADMHRILNDLYYGTDTRTPLEKALEEAEDLEDGFEEAQPADAEVQEDAVEENSEDEAGNDCEGAEDATEEEE